MSSRIIYVRYLQCKHSNTLKTPKLVDILTCFLLLIINYSLSYYMQKFIVIAKNFLRRFAKTNSNFTRFSTFPIFYFNFQYLIEIRKSQIIVIYLYSFHNIEIQWARSLYRN